MILLIDTECPLCVRFSQAIKLVDREGSISYESIYDDDIYERYPKLVREECLDIVHLILQDGTIAQGSQVIEILVKNLPSVKKFAWLIEGNSGKNATNVFYTKVNEIRKKYKKGCRSCGDKGMRK